MHNRVGTSKTHANICDTYVHDCMYEMKTPCTLRREANREIGCMVTPGVVRAFSDHTEEKAAVGQCCRY